MESNFNNRDFEQFVKQNADQYRMFPSEKVWNGIHSTLHTRRKWYGIGLTLLIVSIVAVTWVMLSPSAKNQAVPSKSTVITQPNTFTVQKEQKQTDYITTKNPNTNSSSFVAGLNNWQNSETIVANRYDEVIISPIFKDQIDNKETGSIKIIKPIGNIEPEVNTIFYNTITGTITDDNLDFYLDKTQKPSDVNKAIIEKNDSYPLSIESIINSFHATVTRKKWLWQIYFTPTVSYRKLVENKSSLGSLQSSTTSYYAFYDINNVVTHKPDLGLELGFSAAYPLSKNFRIMGGLQFNVSKYDIKAYNHPTEYATVALRSGPGSSSSVSTTTNYRNFDGYKPNWLHNLYLSASLPIGAELKLSGDTKNYIGIGSSIQPTYILSDRAYLISTDYKNYVEIPQLTRKWNVSTSFEAFASYTTGKINWKVGPQVRYQILSSYQKKYPIKEHLFDFGLKVGIMLNN